MHHLSLSLLTTIISNPIKSIRLPLVRSPTMSVKAAVTPVESAPAKGNRATDEPALSGKSLESNLPFKDSLTLYPAKTTAEDDNFPHNIIELFRHELAAPTRSFSH